MILLSNKDAQIIRDILAWSVAISPIKNAKDANRRRLAKRLISKIDNAKTRDHIPRVVASDGASDDGGEGSAAYIHLLDDFGWWRIGNND